MHTGSDWSMQCCSEPLINSFTGWIDTKGDREKGRKEGGAERTIFIFVVPQRSKTSEVSRDTAAIVRSRRGDDSRLSSELVYKDGSIAWV